MLRNTLLRPKSKKHHIFALQKYAADPLTAGAHVSPFEVTSKLSMYKQEEKRACACAFNKRNFYLALAQSTTTPPLISSCRLLLVDLS